MDTYLLAIGWWNLIGSIMRVGFIHEPFGQKVLNEWTRLFKDKFVLGYWGKLWCFWASGLNVFFGLINILAVKWAYHDIKTFLIWSDICVYLIFLGLLTWGLKAGRLGSGSYSAFIIFGIWLIWGFSTVL